MIDTTKLINVVIGLYVEIVDDTERSLGDEAPLRRGFVKKILSKSDHELGIKVLLTNGRKGRVEYILTKDDLKRENFKYYNELFFEKRLFSIYDRENKNFSFSINKNARIGFIFSNLDAAKDFIEKNKLDKKNFVPKGLSSKGEISNNFKDLYIDKYLINNEKLIKKDKFDEWEKYLKSH